MLETASLIVNRLYPLTIEAVMAQQWSTSFNDQTAAGLWYQQCLEPDRAAADDVHRSQPPFP